APAQSAWLAQPLSLAPAPHTPPRPARRSADANVAADPLGCGRRAPRDTAHAESHTGPPPSRPATRCCHAPTRIARAAPTPHTAPPPRPPPCLRLQPPPPPKTRPPPRSPPPAAAAPPGSAARSAAQSVDECLRELRPARLPWPPATPTDCRSA